MSDLTGLFIADAADRHAMNMYMIGQACGIPALVLGQQLFAFLSLENQTKRTMTASLACIVVNTIMDGVFVFYMKLGTLGLGLGTACGMWTFLLIMASYYFAGHSQMKFSLRKYSPSGTFSILKRGYPGALSRFVELFRCIIVNALIMEYDIIMRIKDNCKSFNPIERINLHEKNEDFGTFGIKIVGNTAKKVQYQNLLGLNVLTIKN